MTAVAIVDDTLIMRMQMRKFFEETMKFTVIAQGSDGNEAISIYRDKKPDLMTLDLTMPNKGGIEALREIMDFNPDARIIVVSAIKDSSMITEALHLGAKGFINKPLQFSSEEFIQGFKDEIEEALEGLDHSE